MNKILRCDWLPERARRSSSPLGTAHLVPPKTFPESHIINPLLTKLVRSRWLDIGSVLFLRVYGPRLSVHKHAKKKELGQYPAIMTSHLVNNPYILSLLYRFNFCCSAQATSMLFGNIECNKNISTRFFTGQS